MSKRVILVGIPKPTHVGLHLKNAAPAAGMEMSVMNMEEAFAGPRLLRALYWRLLGHRPIRLAEFSARLVERCRVERPDFVLTTGLAPVNEAALKQIAAMGIPVANFLTDDPWNPAHRAPWFMHALPHYRHVFTPRHANEDQLRDCGVSGVSYLPFAYAPEDHHPPADLTEGDRKRWGGLVAFIGGADADRVAMVRELVRAGIPVGLWGGYWREQPDLAPYAHGHADAETCRKIVAAAGINLCLVRRANRDGHSMRSYEMPAIGGCLLVEDTPDHRVLFGADGDAVFYFHGKEDLAERAGLALSAASIQDSRLPEKVRQLVIRSGNTYSDRLKTIRSELAA